MYCSTFLKRIVTEKNIRIKDIAKLSEVSETIVSELKNGKKSVKEKTWGEILKHLRLTKEEEAEGWKAWSFDRMDKKTINHVLKLEKENEELKRLLETIKFLKGGLKK